MLGTSGTETSGSIHLSAAEGRLVARLVEIVVEADSIVWRLLGEGERQTLLELGEKAKGGGV